jgi:hypothetical protein
MITMIWLLHPHLKERWLYECVEMKYYEKDGSEMNPLSFELYNYQDYIPEVTYDADRIYFCGYYDVD